jgi:hypothetical protein
MGSDDVAALLAGWREAEQAATPAPWVVYGIGDDEIWSEEPWDHVAETMGNLPDAAFIVTARTAMPRLVAAVEAVLELHTRQDKPVLCWDHVCDAHRDKRGIPVQPPPRDCPGCRFHEMRVCQYCSCPNDEWPCPTYRAITAALTGEEASDERHPRIR